VLIYGSISLKGIIEIINTRSRKHSEAGSKGKREKPWRVSAALKPEEVKAIMFKCKECNSTEFQLVVQPDYQGTLEVSCNEFNEVVVKTHNQEFIADLMFMNQFAVCSSCGSIKNWEYFFLDPLVTM
jgi:hypothetical protein